MKKKDPVSPKIRDILPRSGPDESTGRARARQMIARAAKAWETELSLTNLGLTEVPEEIRQLDVLETLNLSNNDIHVVPKWIGELHLLKTLDVAWNPIESVPDIRGLKLDWEAYLRCRESLSTSNIGGLHISTGRDQSTLVEVKDAERLQRLGKELSQLEVLSIGLSSIVHRSTLRIPLPGHEVSELIQGLDQFQNLRHLNLFGVFLDQVPESIRKLKKLVFLSLVGNGIRSLPRWLSDLSNLRALNISFTELDAGFVCRNASVRGIFCHREPFCPVS